MLTFYKTDRDSYIAEISSSLEVNGEIVDPEGSFKNRLVEFSFEPKNVVKLGTERVFSHYENSRGDKLPAEEYRKQRDDLIKNARGTDDDDEFIFPSVEEEVKYEVFAKTWRAVYVTEKTREKLEFEIKELPYSKSKYITPLHQIGGPLDNPTCEYAPNYLEMLKKCASKYELPVYVEEPFRSSEKTGFSLPNHSKSTLRFLKYNDSYVNLSKPLSCVRNDKRFNLQRSYSELLEKEKEDRKTIENLVKLCVNQDRELKGLPKLTLKKFYKDLCLLYDTINKIDSKVKTQDKKRLASKMAREIISDLSKEI